MWLLLLVSGWEVVTSIMIFSGYCFWSVWFALWCKSIFFDLFWNVKFFIAAKLKGFRLFKVPPGSQWKAIFSVSLVCRSKFRRIDCSLNWSFTNYGELCWDSFMIAPARESFQTWIQLKYQAFAEAGRQDPGLQKHLFPWHVPRSQGRSSVPSSTSLCAGNFIKKVHWTEVIVDSPIPLSDRNYPYLKSVDITCQIWPIRGFTRRWYTGTSRWKKW